MPPEYSTFVNLFCTNHVPRHPLLVLAWASASDHLYIAWLKLINKQLRAKLEKLKAQHAKLKQVNELLRALVFLKDLTKLRKAQQELASAAQKQDSEKWNKALAEKEKALAEIRRIERENAEEGGREEIGRVARKVIEDAQDSDGE